MQLNSLTEQTKGLQTIPHRALEGIFKAAGKLMTRRLAIQQISLIFIFPLFWREYAYTLLSRKGLKKKA